MNQHGSIVMSQLELSMKPEMQEVDAAMVSRQPTMTAALILSQTLSGLEDKEICGKKGLVNDTATWSRIKVGSNNFPQDNLVKWMCAVQNEVPLIWLADRMGYVLTPKETETQRLLRIEREARAEAEAENKLLRNLLVGRT